MADFCKQCSERIFLGDTGDLKGLCTLEDNEKNLYSRCLCEGCGPIQVNYLGECVTDKCLAHHTDGKLFHKVENKDGN